MKRPSHIAVIDDEEDFLTIFKIMFRSESSSGTYRMHFFRNGKEFSDFLLRSHDADLIDLVLTDLNMPLMNGIELLKLTHQSHPQLPVFILSAYSSDEQKNEAFDLGASEYFVKPIDFPKIKSKIEEYL